MLLLPNLDDQSFEEIVQVAINQIKKYGNDWNDIDIHDPGITFIELLAYLKKEQQSKINHVGAKSLSKFLKLLGIEAEYAQGSKAMVYFNCTEDRCLPKGTKLKASNMVFETQKTAKLYANSIKSVGYQKQDTLLLYKYNPESARTLHLFGRNAKELRSFYIGFERALVSKEEIHLYLEIETEQGLQRNPIIEEDSFIPLAKVLWEYYGEKDGKAGWHPLEIIKDETYGFLYSGQLSFKVNGEHLPYEERGEKVFLLRVKAVKYEYEVFPKLTRIWFNSLAVVQQNTLCESIYFNYKDFKDNQMLLYSYLGLEGRYNLYIKNGGEWQAAEERGIVYLLKQLEGLELRLGTSKRAELATLFEGFEEHDAVLKLVIYDNKFYDKRMIGSSNGTAEQIFLLQEEEPAILYKDFEIMGAREASVGQRVIEEWKKVNTLDEWGPTSKVYLFNPEIKGLQFGDNLKGKVPSIGRDNLFITSYKTTQGAEGNIRAGLINRFDKKEWFEGIEVFQLQGAEGGKLGESTQVLLERAMASMKNLERAITLEDYERIAKSTQGLCMVNATAIPLYKPGLIDYPKKKAENTMTVVVEPAGPIEGQQKLESYLENVKKQLNKSKLLTTQLYVTMPEYIGVQIYGEVIVSSHYKDAKELIHQALEKYILDTQKNKLGATLFHGGLCSAIELLECVINVRYLQLEMNHEKVRRNALGDLIIPPHGRTYLEANNILVTAR